jgi:hypothetical protein
MTNTESKKSKVLVTYSEAAIKKALSKYSVKFTVEGVDCRVWQDPDNHTVRNFECGDAADLFFELSAQIEQAIKGCGSKSHIDILDLRKFAIKHIQAMIKVEQSLEEAPESERKYKLLELGRFDRASLSPASQRALKWAGEEWKKMGIISGTDEEIVDEYVDRLLREQTEKSN